MGGKRIRRKRRREFRKPDAAIVSLSTLVVVLLLVWGGLHWQEKAEGKSAVLAAGADDPGREPSSGQELPAAGSESSVAPEEEPTAPATDTEADEPGELGVPTPEASPAEEEPGKGEATPVKRDPKPAKPGGSASGRNPATPGMPASVSKPSQSPSPSAPATSTPGAGEGGTEENAATPSATATETPEIAEPATPSPGATNSPESRTAAYERQIKDVQAACSRDMKGVMSEAENGFQQLNKQDPFAIRAWQENMASGLATAESDCEGKFQAVVVDAEEHSESPEVIEGWKRTFGAMKEELKAESNAKSKQLLGG